MKYILDKNILSNDLIKNKSKRDDLCVTEEVLYEAGLSKQEVAMVRSKGIQILGAEKKHLQKLKEVISAHGSNLKLINLYTNKGTADVMMIAYVLSERDDPQTLFVEEYTLVTRDKELIATAKLYGIPTVPSL